MVLQREDDVEETPSSSPVVSQEDGNTEAEKPIVDSNDIKLVHPANARDSMETDPQQRIEIPIVSWFRQLSFVVRKNYLLLIRRPVLLMVMLFSSIISVLLSWRAGMDDDFDFAKVPLDQCGTVNWDYYFGLGFDGDERYDYDYSSRDRKSPLSYNENWRDGFPVTIIGLGPMILAICAYLFVQPEIESKTLGVLRSLGLRESVYWISWWIPFFFIAVLNAIGGALTAKLINDVHVFESTSFGAIFVSILFLNIGLLGCSFLMVALAGGRRSLTALFILVMVITPWVPYLYLVGRSTIPATVSSVNSPYELSSSPVGLFWINANTSTVSTEIIYDENYTFISNYTTSSCDNPILSKSEAEFLKTPEEKQEVLPDEYFMGCYFAAGLGSYVSTQLGIIKLILAAIPYADFLFIWGNFLGYTAMPNREFNLYHLSMNAETLARRSIGPLDPDNAKGSALYEQGSTLSNFWVDPVYGPNYDIILDNCPAADLSDSFCSFLSVCAGSEQTNSIASNGILGVLLAFAVLYTFLAAYWLQIFPAGNGAAQPFYFPILRSYWFCGGRNTRDAVPEGEIGVSTKSISKVYGKNRAVHNVDVSLVVGEVTALLGHNGAGKTTLSHMLCCEAVQNEGVASVFGLCPAKDKFIVRQLVGVCKQDDYLYPKLTAREHLELFAGLSGIPDSDLSSVVQKWLESVDLDTVQDGYSSSFSGGMKRRLSLACSTIGDRPFIILDEPTTGMDPVSRRFVWKHIDSIKSGRVILLTTHAMEEADLLADTVVIMRKGTVAACGSPLQLKAEHGSSLQFSLLVDQGNSKHIVGLIQERFKDFEEWVDIQDAGMGYVSVVISKVSEESLDPGEGSVSVGGVKVDVLAEFASFLDSDASGVLEYGFSNSSLEEVFLKVTNETRETASPVIREGAEENSNREVLADPEAQTHDTTLQGDTGGEAETEIGSFQPVLTIKGQFRALLKFMFIRDWTGYSSISNWVTHGIFLLLSVLLATNATRRPDNTGILILITFTLGLPLLTVVSPIYQERNSGLFYLTRAQGMMKSAFMSTQIAYSLLLSVFFTFSVLSLVYATPLFRMSEVCPEPDYGYGYHSSSSCKWHYGDPFKIAYQTNLDWWSDQFYDQPVRLYVRRNPGHYGLILGIIAIFPFAAPGTVLAGSHFPGFKIGVSIFSVLFLGVSVLPSILQLVVSSSSDDELEECGWNICNTTFHGNETTVDGREFLNCAGLIANGDRSGSLCMPNVAGLIPQVGIFQGLHMTLMSDLTFTSDPPEYVEEKLIPMLTGEYRCRGRTCQFPYARVKYSSVIGFMTLGAILLFMLGFFLLSAFSFPGKRIQILKSYIGRQLGKFLQPCRQRSLADSKSGDEETAGEVVAETQAVHELIRPYTVTGMGENQCEITNLDSIPRDDMPGVISYHLRKEYALPGGFGSKVALHCLDFHVPKGQVLGLLGKNGAGKSTALKILAGEHDATSGIALVAGYDIRTEQIQTFERLGNCAQFDVIWPGESVRVHLEFFGGLKGVPSDKLPQIAKCVATSVGLGASEVYHRKAGALSGGMRRRLSIAISLIGAPSVLFLDEPTTGLDPSTRNQIWSLIGSFATNNRSIIITTHMMLEADNLCNRIAIVNKGRLKTIGTQQWLKDTYGSGYLLQLNLTHSDKETQDRALQFVREKLQSNAVVQSRQAKTLNIALPRKSTGGSKNTDVVKLSDVFRVLYSTDRFHEGCINQFLFSQSSLEDVFIAMGE